MENKKIKILFAPSDGAGVGHFRSIWPAQKISEMFDSEVEVEINHDFVNDINYYKQFDIVHFHRQLGPYENLENFAKELRAHGTILLMDIDDYWTPEKSHPMYHAAIKEKLAEKIISAFKCVDYVTTTTDIFAEHIRKYNPNVEVMPNALNMQEKQWQNDLFKPSDKVRFAFIGGSSHMADIELMRSSMNILNNDTNLTGKYQIVMCGYDVRGYTTEIGPNGEHINTRKIEPRETIWNKFEEVFTDNYNPNIISPEYKKYLQKCANKDYDTDVYNENFVRRWTLPLTRYGEHYNFCDVAMAPLVENTFNAVKSELKIIESGLKNKVLIAQDFGIYKELIEDGVNGLLVSTKDNTRGWYKAIKRLIEDPELRNNLAKNLNNFVKDKYIIETTATERMKFYKKIIAESKQKRELQLEEVVN